MGWVFRAEPMGGGALTLDVATAEGIGSSGTKQREQPWEQR